MSSGLRARRAPKQDGKERGTKAMAQRPLALTKMKTPPQSANFVLPPRALLSRAGAGDANANASIQQPSLAAVPPLHSPAKARGRKHAYLPFATASRGGACWLLMLVYITAQGPSSLLCAS